MSEQLEDQEYQADQSAKKAYVSVRGAFKVFENPEIVPPIPSAKIKPEKAAANFDYSKLAEKFGEQATAEKVGQMVQAFSDGTSTTPLFGQSGPNGMSLVHVWFGPNFPLFRHSHPRYGDCLYYVVAGEAILGKRQLGPGSGFFVPNGMPYKYTAGPAGVELLEFRAGGGEKDQPGMRLDELSLDSMQKIIDSSNENRDKWQPPAKIGDTAFRQAELDFSG